MRLALVLVLLVAAGPALADHPERVSCVGPCPDLVVDGERLAPYVQETTFAHDHCAVEEGMTQPGARRLVRFTLTTPNVGAGDLVVGVPGLNSAAFEWAECHQHYHFREYADYRLWSPAGFDAWQALRAASPDAQAHELLAAHPELQPLRGEKRGFCMIDVRAYDALLPPKFRVCDFQGVSAGWADEYDSTLDGQWIDVTGMAAGVYVLETEVNAARVFAEAGYANNRAWTLVEV